MTDEPRPDLHEPHLHEPDGGQPDGGEHDRSDGRAATTSAMVGLVVVALMALVAVLAFAARSDDGVVSSGGDDAAPNPISPPTMIPTEPEPMVPTQPGGVDSALVGLTEDEVRADYVIVRVVERDGAPLMSTMDLVQGRIDLSVEDDVVVGATTEGCDEIAAGATGPSAGHQPATGEQPASADVPGWLRQACDPTPGEDGPNVTGTLRQEPGASSLVLDVDDGGDDQFQGMAVRATDATQLRDATGAPIAADGLSAGDRVRVWTAPACRESFPVQCDIQAIVLTRSAGN